VSYDLVCLGGGFVVGEGEFFVASCDLACLGGVLVAGGEVVVGGCGSVVAKGWQNLHEPKCVNKFDLKLCPIVATFDGIWQDFFVVAEALDSGALFLFDTLF